MAMRSVAIVPRAGLLCRMLQEGTGLIGMEELIPAKDTVEVLKAQSE